MDFLILRPLPPKTRYHFFEGGWVGWGGGVKSFCSEASKQWGRMSLTHNCRSNGNAADVKFSVGGSNPGRLTFGAGAGGVKSTLPGLEPPTKEAPVGCTTIRPLLGLSCGVSALLGAASATDKKPMFCQKHIFCIPLQDWFYLFVCFCLTDCWPGSGTDWLTVNLPSRCTAEGNRIYEREW